MTKHECIVIGDAFVDRWLTIGGTRASAEQVGLPIYDISSERQQHGGAANVANALRQLVRPGHMRVNDTLLQPLHARPIKTRLLMQGRQVCRFDIHDNIVPTAIGQSTIKEGDVVVISDYCKGGIGNAQIQAVADSKASQIWVNAKSIQPGYEYLGVARHSGGLYWTCNEAEWQAARDFYDNQGCVYVTKAEKGIEVREYGLKTGDYPTFEGPVVSVCGAGDVVLAALIAAPADINRPKWAMAAASVAVAHPFTYCPTREEVEKVYYGQ